MYPQNSRRLYLSLNNLFKFLVLLKLLRYCSSLVLLKLNIKARQDILELFTGNLSSIPVIVFDMDWSGNIFTYQILLNAHANDLAPVRDERYGT